MQNFNETKLELLRSINKLTQAIDNEIDWFLASSSETDPKKKHLLEICFMKNKKKQDE